ncbi:MAG TPA: LamG-like jellyroll fold domain-containing protein [Pilimelia sp.]|nr:LamG-like jellyroll fold domain-containing protein [Pilimelia sp.]
MKVKVPILLALAAAMLPGAPAVAAPATALAAETMVARYPFDAGAVNGAFADTSGRGLPLRVRAADGGAPSLVARGTGRAVAFPARCAANAASCPRVVLEGGDDADLDPGTRAFRYGAWVRATAAQTGHNANIMQKGVATAESQWKLQIGGRKGKAHCVLVGRGSRQAYIAKSSVTVNDGAWHSLVCSRTATALTVYVDGVARGTVAVPPNLTVANDLPLRVGGQNLSNRTDQFGGALDDVFVAVS